MYRQILRKNQVNQTEDMRNLKFDKEINDFYFVSSGWYNGIKFRK